MDNPNSLYADICKFITDKSVKSMDLGLRAVLCLNKKKHFTCFVRTKAAAGEKATWYFHDSMATENGSMVRYSTARVVLKDLTLV